MKKIQCLKMILCLLLIPVFVFQVSAAQTDLLDSTTVVSGAQSPDGKMPVFEALVIPHSARSAILYEMTSDTLVYSQQADLIMEPSSLTKIMTALIAIENCDLEDTVYIDWEVLDLVPANALITGLLYGEEVTLEQLLYLLIVGGGNDAACIIADHVAGSQEAFVAMMNRRALELGCTGTVFMNVHGIHEEGHVSTARDLLKILRKSMDYPAFAEIFTTDRYVLEATELSPERYYHTTNYMGSDALTDEYYDSRVLGGRTGNTEEGYRNFAAVSEQDGSVYLSVVLESVSEYSEDNVMLRQGAFEDTALLLDLGFEQCSTVQVVYEGQVLTQLPVTGGDSDVAICADSTVSSVVPKDMDPTLLTTKMNLTAQNLTAPVEEGTYVGQYQVYYGQRCIASVSLITGHSVRSAPVPTTPAAEPEDPGFDPGALTTALAVLGIIFAVILVLFGGLFLLRWFRSFRGQSRKQKRRSERRRSK